AAQVIARGGERLVDIGVAKPAQQAPHLATKHQSGPLLSQVAPEKHGFFAHALTIGVNVQFARLATNVVTRQRFGRLTYPLAALEVLRYHQSLDVEIHFEGLARPQTHNSIREAVELAKSTDTEQTALRCRALQVAVINAP